MIFSEKTLQAARGVLTLRNPPRADLRRTTTPQRNPLSIRDATSAYRETPFHGGDAYVQWMERTGMPATREQLEGAANTIRLRRNPNASGVSPNWLTGWRRNHPEITQTYLKAVERSRKTFET
ncbi:hypothetical protein E5D57_004014 [Metarhizium anisopliae]|nr:hypothetical protein E5D57_004014 [Metarhizium anisopliae]